MTTGRSWLPIAARAGRLGTVLVLAVLVVRLCATGLSSLDGEVAKLAAQQRVLTVRGGDVSLRDAPKALEFRQGRLFSDPYYAGEHHWYPFAGALAAAAVGGLTGSPIPEAFFRAEVAFVALYLVGLAVLAFVACGWPGLLFLPLVAWLGALVPGNGLYPIESVRGAFCLFLALAGWLNERGAGSRQSVAGLGAAVGLLGLWNGAAFFVAAAVAGLMVAAAAWRAAPGQRRRALVGWWPMLAGAAIPLALLFAPQVLRHGRLAMPDAARMWMADVYQGGTLVKALTLSLAPRGLHLVLLLALYARLAAGRRLGLETWRRVLPLALAYAGCLLVAHLGFVSADRAHPLVARVAGSILPAPAHTFLATAEAIRPAVELAGLLALVQLCGRALRGRLRTPAWLAELVPALSLVACAALVFTFPYRITRFAASETLAFDRFARQVGTLTGGTPVFFRYPGRFLQGTSIKILKLSVAEYANPYVHAQRTRAEEAIDAALQAGQPTRADALLQQYGIAFIMEDPRAPADPVIRRCGGAVLAQHEGYILRRREPCRM